MKTPNEVSELHLDCTCVSVNEKQWERLMKNAKRADKRKINSLVKHHLPELYESLCLNLYNPYHYFKTKTHLILVHSHIEYFLTYIK